jgi:hypothetical protein
MRDFWDSVLVWMAVVGTIAIAIAIIFMRQYAIFALLACGILCCVIGMFIALFPVVNG